MAKLLEQFASVLPRLQARNIEKSLQRPEQRLRFASAGEFRAAFQAQLRSLLQNDSTVRLDPISLEYDSLRESELVDEMLRLIAGDLSALFAEADLYLQTEELQSELYKNEIVGKLRRAVAEAEAEIERLELLRGNTTGLKAAIVEKFRDSSSRMSRSDPFAYTAFVDPKLNITPDPQFDMPVAVNVGGLVLPALQRETIRPSRIQDIQNSDSRDDLVDRFALPRALSASTPGGIRIEGNINNVIDRQRGTFWIKTVYTDRIEPGGAKLNISIDLGPSPTGVNFVEIQPVSNFGMELSEAYYVDEVAHAYEIELQTSPVNLTEAVRLFFKRTDARKLVLVFTQKNWEEVTTPESTTYKYCFGIDNIIAGEVKYASIGYYVSKTLGLPQINKLHLAATENAYVGVPQGADLSPESDPLPLIEYWAVVREIDGSNNILSTTYLPILPVGTTVMRERLIVESSHKALLNFMIDPSTDDADVDLKLYRDGNEILRPIDYQFEPPATSNAGRAVLAINGGYNFDYEYIAEYTPFHTQEGSVPIPFVDPTQLIRYNTDNTISLTRPESSQAVRSEANLIIVMRGVGNGIHTAVVDEITFAVG